MQMTKLGCCLLALALVVLSGCAVDPKYSPLKPLEGADRKVNINDIRLLRQMDRTPILDPNLIGFVQRIRQRLEDAWGKPCDCVVVVDSFSGYEAYSLSTTTIVVSAGLIAQAGSEDEVAAVIAHELGHVYQGDTTKGSQQQIALDMAKLAGWATGAGGYTLLLGETVDDVTKGLVYRRWNQDQEIAADGFSAQLLLKAGYSLDGLKMAIRRLGRYSEGALLAKAPQTPNCVTSKNGNYQFNLRGCSKALSGVDESIYQSSENRLEPIMKLAASLPPEQRRRRQGGPLPVFSSTDYLFRLNDLVSSNQAQLKATLAKIEAQPMPKTLQGNVAVTNKLAMAYAIAGDSERAKSYLRTSLQSTGRTAWTFNMLFKEVDRSGDQKQVRKAIEDSHLEVGYMAQLLPVEYYLTKRHGLQVYELVAYGRCASNLVDDVATYNACSKFEKLAKQYGGASW
ncbi:M48 family metalloprotease [Pseudomonas sp. Teo4]|uniref:M48 family metalloprotease n=1 Tax=Pseudomonas sp. Teo4 TaxID=3064528 RepID=UPI002ABA9914|nr:M48 family metalloprotease [Pseudomonas sp. Teo4]MDZ3993847.1 Beta-barrel assembly-enhancing protease [Pseudomonas sp. Teo4]